MREDCTTALQAGQQSKPVSKEKKRKEIDIVTLVSCAYLTRNKNVVYLFLILEQCTWEGQTPFSA